MPNLDTPARPAALSSAAAAEYLGLSAGHLRNLRSRGDGPAYVRVSDSPRSGVLYLIDDLDGWLASRERVVGGDL
ncbi:helix-turn-helix domain-containing protein [Corynebacterium glyciniphilum]|uniref:helix-turn-helix domain-containing protein n=1 Tax=Corynebacterium glyciniphilum TaxID=1404244 RepID=UPI002656B679|nr:helix-turn-helix domain-containing protein [Corynebacterium glyciniphilum]MDN5684790.1 helix-turn-helix domain-containing protein [Corynebacterium glyciniphilum]